MDHYNKKKVCYSPDNGFKTHPAKRYFSKVVKFTFQVLFEFDSKTANPGQS